MKKRVLLFWPNTANRGKIALSIPILSSIAKNAGWAVKYFDTSFYEKSDDSVTDREKTGSFKPVEEKISLKPASQIVTDFGQIINKFNPDLIAITGMTNDFQYMMSFWPHLYKKIAKPKTKIVFGGIHALHKSDEVLTAGMDLSCFGQAENIFPEILRRIEYGQNLKNIPGTSHLNRWTHKIHTTYIEKALSPEEIWSLEPDYSFYDDRYYRCPFDGKMVNMFWLEVGRGCLYNCSYCEAPQLRQLYKDKGKYVITRPMDSIFSTIQNLFKERTIDIFNITHECFLSQPKVWLKEFCQRWKKEVGKSFLIQTRMETIDEEKLDILQTSGAPIIQIGQGIESGSQRILKEICNRKMHMGAIVLSYKIMKNRGFRTNAFYMVGFPTETREEIFETIDLCRKINSNIDSVSIFQPYPGLPLTKTCIKNGWITGNETIPSFTEKSIINQPSISPEEVSNLRRVFLLYAKLPKEYWPQIKQCEDNPQNTKLFQELIVLRWKLNDS